MEQKLIEKTKEFCQSIEELKQLWMDYVKQQNEVDLDGKYITMWDGSGERMRKITHHDDCVYVVDVFGNAWPFDTDTGPETLVELYDVVFVRNRLSED